MYESKYNKVLTILLIVIIVLIILILGFFGFRYYQTSAIPAQSSDYVNQLYNEMIEENNTSINTQIGNELENNTNIENQLNEILNSASNENNSSSGDSRESTTSKQTKKMYKGHVVLGTIEIPATKVSYPILEDPSESSIRIATAKLYGVNPNEVGNMVIESHNYRNGKLFSNNKKLSLGDVVYITDLYGNKEKVKYTIYNKYETTPEATDYMTRDTEGKREITLYTCTDDSKARLVIWAKAD